MKVRLRRDYASETRIINTTGRHQTEKHTACNMHADMARGDREDAHRLEDENTAN